MCWPQLTVEMFLELLVGIGITISAYANVIIYQEDHTALEHALIFTSTWLDAFERLV